MVTIIILKISGQFEASD